MAHNNLPRRIGLLMAMAEEAADGAESRGAEIGLQQNTEAAIRADLAALETAQNEFQAARKASFDATAAQRTADAEGEEFIATAKDVLSPVLGRKWSSAWLATGFVTSLAIPQSIDRRQTRLGSLRDYFTANPARENPPLDVTAARAAALHTALSDARSAVHQGKTDKGQKQSARDAARKAMEKRLRGLIGELKQLIADDDPRWLAFGLKMPAAKSTADAE